MTVFPMSNTSVDSTSVGSVNSSAGSGSEKKKATHHLCDRSKHYRLDFLYHTKKNYFKEVLQMTSSQELQLGVKSEDTFTPDSY